LWELLANFWSKNPSASEKERILKALKFVKERANLLDELAKNLEIYYDNFCGDLDQESAKIINEKKSLLNDLQKVFLNLNDWNHDGIKNSLDHFAAANSLKIKDFGPALRIALTFSSASAGGIFDVIEILGKDEVVRRIDSIK
jgi:glutamyl/glutaminyl-tRNA synthetase